MKCPCCNSDLENADRPLISLETNKLLAGAEVLQLTPREAEIIDILVKRMPLPVSADYFVARLYGDVATEAAMTTIRVILSKLRPKIAICGLNIRTIWGGGYVLEYAKARAA